MHVVRLRGAWTFVTLRFTTAQNAGFNLLAENFLVNEKEFGKLSLDQLKELVVDLADLKPQRKDLTTRAKEDLNGFLKESPGDFSWADYYSLTIVEMVALMLYVGGLNEELHTALKKDDPQQYLLDTFKALEPSIRDLGDGQDASEYVFAALSIALLKSLESIEIYGCSCNGLVQRVRSGDDKALFDIVRLDHSAVGNSEIASRIAKAGLRQDKKFFIKLSKAIKGVPLKYTQAYGPLRYLILTLYEMGELSHLSTEDLYQLFCIDLKLYPTSGSDPARSLKRLVERWISENATRPGDFMSSPS